MSTRKYYFGWYKYGKKWWAGAWTSEFPILFTEVHSTEVSEEEWKGPLAVLEHRYASLRPDSNQT